MKDNNLFYSKTFRWCILAPIFISAFVHFCIFYFGSYSLDLSSHGFSTYYNDYKVGIWLAGLALPISGLYAAIFRSQQTAKQIEIAQENNYFNNHFKHIEEFKSHVDEHFIDFSGDHNFNVSTLHNALFPNTIHGSLHLGKHIIAASESLIQSISSIFPVSPLTIPKLHKLAANFYERVGLPTYVQNKDISLDLFSDILKLINSSSLLFGRPAPISDEEVLKSIKRALEFHQRYTKNYTSISFSVIKTAIETKQIPVDMKSINIKPDEIPGFCCILIQGVKEPEQLNILLYCIKTADIELQNSIKQYVEQCLLECHNYDINVDNLLRVIDI